MNRTCERGQAVGLDDELKALSPGPPTAVQAMHYPRVTLR